MSRDFSAVPTHILCRDTIERSNDIYDITISAFIRCGVAYAAIAFPICTALFFTGDATTILGITGVVAIGPVIWWLCGLRNCARFTLEMKAREKEIKRRRRAADPEPGR